MKITAVKTFVCNAFRTNFVFVKIETDSDIHGWGEATLEYKEPIHQLPCHIEILLRFTGKTDDHIGGKGQIGNRLPQFSNFFQIAGGGVLTVHRFQDPVRTALQRQMDIVADFGTICQCGNQPFIEVAHIR